MDKGKLVKASSVLAGFMGAADIGQTVKSLKNQGLGSISGLFSFIIDATLLLVYPEGVKLTFMRQP